jgi:hypothetical protein
VPVIEADVAAAVVDVADDVDDVAAVEVVVPVCADAGTTKAE